ncbi:MAG: DcrB-related protein [bacterium]
MSLFPFKKDHNHTISRPKAGSSPSASPLMYQGNDFTIHRPEGWRDTTIYTLAGPVEDGIQHTILIMADHNASFESVAEYAEVQINALVDQLQGCRLLKQGHISLDSGVPAYQAIFNWCPTEQTLLYQQQVFVLQGKTGYKLTATFTRKTRKTLGPTVERILMSFNPTAA